MRLLSTGWSKFRARGSESRQKPGEMSDFCLPDSPKSGRADLKVGKNREKCLIFVYRTLQIRSARLESRQKPEGMCDFCLPDSPNPGRAVSKVEQNHPKLKKYSTAASKFKVRGTKSRTKSSKIEKIFYSVTFAKTVWTQITGTSQKSPFCSQPNSDAVIE